MNERNFLSTSNILGLNPNSSFIKFVTESKLLNYVHCGVVVSIMWYDMLENPGRRLITRKPSVSSFRQQTVMGYL